MARKVDAAAVAAKRRQQMIVLAVGGVLLAGLVMLQAPKVLNHGKNKSSSSTSTTASSSTDSSTSTTSTTTPATSSTDTGSPSATTPTPIITGHGPAAKVAGVLVRSAGSPKPDTGQLWSLSRFKVRDPFIQQVADTSGSSSTTAGSSAAAGAKNAAGAGAPTTTGPGGIGIGSTGGTVVPSTVTPAALAYVTLMVNGRAQQLTLRDVFPQGQPTFVVRSVGKKYVTIGVAGGRFVGGAIVKLKFGERVTLMNTATGQRFVMKLVYTGSQPEHIAGFNAPATTTPVAPATTASTAAPKA